MAPGPGKGPHLPTNAQGMHKGTNEHVLDGSDQNSHDYCSAPLAAVRTLAQLPPKDSVLMSTTGVNPIPYGRLELTKN